MKEFSGTLGRIFFFSGETYWRVSWLPIQQWLNYVATLLLNQFITISDIGKQLFADPNEKDKLIEQLDEHKSILGFETRV